MSRLRLLIYYQIFCVLETTTHLSSSYYYRVGLLCARARLTIKKGQKLLTLPTSPLNAASLLARQVRTLKSCKRRQCGKCGHCHTPHLTYSAPLFIIVCLPNHTRSRHKSLASGRVIKGLFFQPHMLCLLALPCLHAGKRGP